MSRSLPIRNPIRGLRSTPMPTVRTPPLTGWSPVQVGVRGLIPRLRLNPLGLTPTGFAFMIGTFLVEEMFDRAILWLSGLRFHKSCSPGFYQRFTTTPGDGCLIGVGSASGNTMADLARNPPPTTGYVQILSEPYLAGAGLLRRRTVDQFTAITATDYLGRRPRPWVEPLPTRPARPSDTLNRPGDVPTVVPPWPVWVGPRPWPVPRPTSHPQDEVEPTTRPWRWEWDTTRPQSRPSSRPVTRPVSEVRVVPSTLTKEVKVGANTRAAQMFFQLMRARELVSEIGDMWEVLYASLPKSTRKAYGGNQVSDAQMLRALYDNWDRIDPMLFLENLIANQIEDEIIGRTWIKYRAQLRNIMFDGMMGSTGTVASPSFKEYAKAVSNLARHLAKGMRDEAERAGWDRQFNNLSKAVDDSFRRLLTSGPNQRRI